MIDEMGIHARLAACKLIPGRWAGRKELTRRATSSVAALIELEARVGLRSAQSARWAQYRTAFPAQPRGGIQENPRGWWGADRAAARTLHDSRASRERPAMPAPGRILALQAARRAARQREWLTARDAAAIAAAGFRVATHGHTTVCVAAAPDRERAVSTTDTVWPSLVSLPGAYGTWRVTLSTHTWYVSPDVPVRRVGEYVYLSDTRRVRQGRGTSLVTEELVSGARGHLAWRAL